MVITKDRLQNLVDGLPDSVDIEVVFDKILLSAKIDNALKESEQGLGQNWDEFKREWLSEE